LTDAPAETVLVLDDYPLVRLGIFTALFNSRYDVLGLGDRSDIAGSLEEHQPGLVVIGADLRDLRDSAFIESISKEPCSPVVLLTEVAVAFPALRRRAKVVRGLLHRQATADELVACLDRVSRGYIYMSRRLEAQLTGPVANEAEAPRLGRLSLRETEVLQLVRSGLSNREIGSKLGISRETVAVHLRAIRMKLAVRNRADMATLDLPHNAAGAGAAATGG
jgi:DNA-binding NarL/FixJ family response regulator